MQTVKRIFESNDCSYRSCLYPTLFGLEGAKMNPFTAFFEDQTPHTATLCEERYKETSATWVLVYNGKDVDTRRQCPDHAAFKSKMRNMLHYRELDYRTNPASAIAYAKCTAEDIEGLLGYDFNSYFI